MDLIVGILEFVGIVVAALVVGAAVVALAVLAYIFSKSE